MLDQGCSLLLARRMIELERQALEAERGFHYGLAERLWRQRLEVQHMRSLLLRLAWAERARRLLGEPVA